MEFQAHIIGIRSHQAFIPVSNAGPSRWLEPSNDGPKKLFDLAHQADTESWALGNLLVGESQVSEFVNVMGWKNLIVQCDWHWLAQLHSITPLEGDPSWLAVVAQRTGAVWDHWYRDMKSFPDHSFRKILKG